MGISASHSRLIEVPVKMFRSLGGGRNAYLVLIYNTRFPVLSGKAWAISIVDADKTDDAAAKMVGYAGEMMNGADAEFLKLPKAIAAKLKDIERGHPIGDHDPRAQVIRDACGQWLEDEVMRRRRGDGGEPAKVISQISSGENVVAIVADLPPKKQVTH